MRSIPALAVVALAVASSASAESPALPTEAAVHAALDGLALDPHMPGAAIAVVADGRIEAAATGVAAPDGRPMTAGTPVRLASVTKTFTAAAVLRLWETRRLDLGAPIAGLIAPGHDAMLRGGGYDTGAITLRHLLMHAGGLSDHAESEAYLAVVLENPSRVWTRREQIAVMLEIGPPLAPPGDRFAYSDTGYILLGEVIERVTGEPLGAALRSLLRWDALDLSRLRWEGEPPAPGPARAHQWMGGIDTTKIHGSIDAFGGGGLVASVADAAHAYAAIASGASFDRPETLALMLEAPRHPEGSPYRMGLFAGGPDEAPVYRHGGFWGLHAVMVPSCGRAIVAVGLDQAMTPRIVQMLEGFAECE